MLRLVSLRWLRSWRGASAIRLRSHVPDPWAPNRSASRLGVMVADKTTPRLMSSAHPWALVIFKVQLAYPHARRLRISEMATPGPNAA